MALDPDIAALVDLVNAQAAANPDRRNEPPEARREAYHQLVSAVPAGPELASITDRQFDGPESPIGLRVYQPSDPEGIVVFYHGGGWVIGDLDTHDAVCRHLAQQAGTTVVSVDYRLAPEHPFPAAVNDCYAALNWVDANRQALGHPPQAKLAVAGDSAGGNLAAVAALLARDTDGPKLAAQLLVYPSVDIDGDYPSRVENGEGYVLTAETMAWFRNHYLGERDDADWRISPLHAPSLDGLPPALVMTVQYDPLRDEGAAYAEALSRAGVEVTHTNYDNTVHLFFQLPGLMQSSDRAVAEAAAFLAEHLGP